MYSRISQRCQKLSRNKHIARSYMRTAKKGSGPEKACRELAVPAVAEDIGNSRKRSGRGFAFNCIAATLGAVSSNIRRIIMFFEEETKRSTPTRIHDRRRKDEHGHPLDRGSETGLASRATGVVARRILKSPAVATISAPPKSRLSAFNDSTIGRELTEPRSPAAKPGLASRRPVQTAVCP